MLRRGCSVLHGVNHNIYICIYIYIYIYTIYIVYHFSSYKLCTLRSASPVISAAPLNTALTRIVTIFYYRLNQNGYGTRIQTIKQLRYCWYLDFLLYMVCWWWKFVSFLFWKKRTTRFSHLTLFISLTLK